MIFSERQRQFIIDIALVIIIFATFVVLALASYDMVVFLHEHIPPGY